MTVWVLMLLAAGDAVMIGEIVRPSGAAAAPADGD